MSNQSEWPEESAQFREAVAKESQLGEISGVRGVVDMRVINLGAQLFFEAEPQDESYWYGDPPRPPIVRIPIVDTEEATLTEARSYVPEALEQTLAAIRN
jgi:hypothetical protein